MWKDNTRHIFLLICTPYFSIYSVVEVAGVRYGLIFLVCYNTAASRMYYCNRQKQSPQKPLHFFGSDAILQSCKTTLVKSCLCLEIQMDWRDSREKMGRKGSTELYFPQNKASGNKMVPKSLHLCLKGPF